MYLLDSLLFLERLKPVRPTFLQLYIFNGSPVSRVSIKEERQDWLCLLNISPSLLSRLINYGNVITLELSSEKNRVGELIFPKIVLH